MAKRVTRAAIALSLGLLTGASAIAVAAVPATVKAATGGGSQSVIIVMKHQYSYPQTSAGISKRVAAADTAQQPVIASLQASHATKVTQLHVLDAVAATVTPAESSALAGDSSVAEVVPNAEIKGPPPVTATQAKNTATATLAPGTCPAAGQTQLDPEGVELVHAVSDNPAVPTARSLGYTGAGVRVGDIAVGIDPDEPELIRPDGQPVIAEYKDFTGEGTSVQGGEDLESYLDDSVMAAQGRLVYDLHDYTPSMPAGCDIKLQGVAPGISLYAYKVYANDDMTTTSAFLEAIDYAVDVNHVNVLNEEGGSFPFPDTSQDLIKEANAAAMAAGVTITSPSYDSGPENSIWSPSTQPGVISVGASTAFRSYAQDDAGEYSQMGATGWVSDNISSLSSGGSTESGRTIDVVAPGDLDWIACEAGTVACGNSNLVLSGGTSEAGPIVAAVAALVIQAYRSTHGGATPSAGLVRDIISSSADDLGLPGSEQGSGLVDAYRAVKAAMAASGPAVVASTQQLAAVGNPDDPTSMSFQVSNDGTTPANVSLAARTLGTSTVVATKTIQETATSPTDQIFTFRLAHGASELTADIAAPDDANPVSISLVNPQGKFTAYSLPQGTGDHGQVEVRAPSAGTWTADISTASGPYTGPVYVQVTTAQSKQWGTVSPRSVRLAPGASQTVTVSGRFPAQPGDQSASVTVQAPGWGDSSIPVTLRSLIPLASGTGHFSGTLIGGNGRGGVPAQTFFYQADVPAGQPALDVQTKLADGNDDPYYEYLVDPQGEAVAEASNQVPTASGTFAGEPGARLHLLSPQPGRWTIIITFTNPVTGDQLETGLSGTVSFTPVTAAVTGLPDSAATTLAPGTAHTVSVTIRNDGDAAESYFLDGRLDSEATMTLTSITPSTSITLPELDTGPYPQWIVPTDTTSLTASAVSTAPTTFDFAPYNGEPDIGATVDGDDATASIAAQPGTALTQGDWYILPQQVGPFGASGAPQSTTSLSLTATTQAFDPALTTSTGDLWEQGAAAQAAFKPVVVQPGQTVTLQATITPAASAGSVVHGTLYLDDSSAVTNYGYSPSGDQLEAVPYRYKVG